MVPFAPPATLELAGALLLLALVALLLGLLAAAALVALLLELLAMLELLALSVLLPAVAARDWTTARTKAQTSAIWSCIVGLPTVKASDTFIRKSAASPCQGFTGVRFCYYHEWLVSYTVPRLTLVYDVTSGFPDARRHYTCMAHGLSISEYQVDKSLANQILSFLDDRRGGTAPP